jgi:hypothetical protein
MCKTAVAAVMTLISMIGMIRYGITTLTRIATAATIAIGMNFRQVIERKVNTVARAVAAAITTTTLLIIDLDHRYEK